MYALRWIDRKTGKVVAWTGFKIPTKADALRAHRTFAALLTALGPSKIYASRPQFERVPRSGIPANRVRQEVLRQHVTIIK